MKQNSLFPNETSVIKHSQTIADDPQYQNEPLLLEYIKLADAYTKLFKQFSRTVTISDKQQIQLKASKEAIVIQNRKLEHLNATKDKLFSIIAHDLKSPFHAFLNLNTLLVRKIDSYSKQEILEFASEINANAENLYKLIENLLRWAQMQMDKFDFQPTPFPLQQLVTMSLDQISAQASAKQITIISTVPKETIVVVDPDMINVVLRNLISNAVKFTNPNGKITIASQLLKNQIEISITDTGIGMSPEDCQKLFRLDTTHSTPGTANEKGTGLGLILCKEMIEKHNGTIHTQSTLGQGTTFTISIPT